MVRLNSYSGDSFEFHQNVINSKHITKNDSKYKQRVNSLNPRISIAFDEYRLQFEADSLELLSPILVNREEKTDLENLYDYSSSTMRNLKISLTTTPDNRRRSTCANCTISEVSSFDHALPQSEFIEFVVNPKNLIPSCTICNGKKNRFWKGANGRLFINHYLDYIPEEQYLFADINFINPLDIEVSYRLSKPDEVEEVFFRRISTHYHKLGLLARFAENPDDVLSEFKNQLRSLAGILPRLEAETCIRESISLDQGLFGNNYWKCVLKLSLLANEHFMASTGL